MSLPNLVKNGANGALGTAKVPKTTFLPPQSRSMPIVVLQSQNAMWPTFQPYQNLGAGWQTAHIAPALNLLWRISASEEVQMTLSPFLKIQ